MKHYIYALWVQANEYEWIYCGIYERKTEAIKRGRKEVVKTDCLKYQVDTHVIDRKEPTND